MLSISLSLSGVVCRCFSDVPSHLFSAHQFLSIRHHQCGVEEAFEIFYTLQIATEHCKLTQSNCNSNLIVCIDQYTGSICHSSNIFVVVRCLARMKCMHIRWIRCYLCDAKSICILFWEYMHNLILHEANILHCACVTRCIKSCFLFGSCFFFAHSFTLLLRFCMLLFQKLYCFLVSCVCVCVFGRVCISTLIRPNAKRPTTHQTDMNRFRHNWTTVCKTMNWAQCDACYKLFSKSMPTCECSSTPTQRHNSRRRKSKLQPNNNV